MAYARAQVCWAQGRRRIYLDHTILHSAQK